ncbi:MAG: phage BR0599 family protein [Smithellaceae bacterium]
MKTATTDYIALETADESTPIEVYKFWTADDTWHLTDGDAPFVYDGDTYLPAAISRGPVTQNEDPASNTCTITMSRLTEPAVQYVASLPMHTMRVMITRLHRTQDPLEGEVKFAGFVGTPTVKGAEVQAACVSIAKWMDQPIPNYRLQPLCNASLFDDECGLTAADYQTDGTIVAANETGTVLTADEFALEDDGYFELGHVLINGHRRMITQHIGTSVTLRYPIPVPDAGDAFSAWPGCNGAISTCLAKFNNKDNHRGYPDMPLDNPTLWI